MPVLCHLREGSNAIIGFHLAYLRSRWVLESVVYTDKTAVGSILRMCLPTCNIGKRGAGLSLRPQLTFPVLEASQEF